MLLLWIMFRFYIQAQVGWLMVGELLSIATFPVVVGMAECLERVYLDIGVNAEFLLAGRAHLHHLARNMMTVGT